MSPTFCCVGTNEAAFELYTNSREFLSSGGFNLRTWTMEQSENKRYGSSGKLKDLDIETKVLGKRWNSKADILTFAQQKNN